MVVVVVLLAVVAVLAEAAPASARIMIDDGGDDGGDGGGGDDGGDDDNVDTDCLGGISAWLSAEPAEVKYGESTTLSWGVDLPQGCPAMTNLTCRISYVGPVNQSGSQVIPVQGPGTAFPDSWELQVQIGSKWVPLARASVGFISEVVTITSSNQVDKFVEAITEKPYARVEIQNHVVLNLSGKEFLDIAPGVQIIGGRSATDLGPLLYTSTYPSLLFVIGGYSDNVRISGIRLQGATYNSIAAADDPGSVGIRVSSSVNIEIDNNELFGWRGAAVEVRDPFNRINGINFDTVRVHDNYIHNNEHYRKEGYGVAVYESAYALIAKNVFDYNRHAIASSGAPGTGYYAVGNLVFENGGLNIPGPPWTFHTHIFDVHGTTDCYGADLYCGPAGEYFSYTYNTILYTNGTAIKVRGKPSGGAFASHNVFAHSDQWGGIVDDAAMVQNDPGDNFYATQNTFGATFTDMLVSAACDFNGDGAPDDFLATGATWWYRSNAFGPLFSSWRHLRTSPVKRNQLIFFGDLNSDGICDMKDNNGVIYLGGVTVVLPPPPSDPLIPSVIGDTLKAAESALTAAGYIRGTVSYVVDQSCEYIGVVAHQSPLAGTKKAAGTLVNLSIGKQPSTPCGYAQ
jgi:hypothetical protein